MELLIVVGQSLAIYVFLVIALARLGRPQMTELTPLGYLATALLGSAVETGLYHGSTSLAAGLVSAATLIAASYVTTWLMNRWPRLRRRLVGAPVVLIYDGQILHGHLRQALLTEQDLRAAVRKRGYDNLEAVRLAVLEVDGSVGVVPRSASHPSAGDGTRRAALSGGSTPAQGGPAMPEPKGDQAPEGTRPPPRPTGEQPPAPQIFPRDVPGPAEPRPPGELPPGEGQPHDPTWP